MPRRSYRGAGGASSRGDIEAGQPAGGETSPRSPRARGRDVQLDAGGATSAGAVDLDARAGVLRAQSLQDPTGTRKIGRPHTRGTAPGGP
jgi:hypothetical protein